MKFDFKPKERFTIFALQIGGFLPLCFTGANLLILDRNVVISAENILRGGRHRDNKANIWWHNFINRPSYLLNPCLAALESSSMSIPTYEEFHTEFERCCEILRRAFPKARVLNYTSEARKGAYDLVEEITKHYNEELAFLQDAVPLIAVRNPEFRLASVEEELFSLSRNSGLSRPTLSLLACLSCLYEGATNEAASPARRVLKTKQKYTESMAHNAIMDLYSLQFLIQGSARLDTNVSLCTSDKPLLKFWCAMKVKPGGTVTARGFEVNMELSDAMFPNLNERAIIDLKQRLDFYTC